LLPFDAKREQHAEHDVNAVRLVEGLQLSENVRLETGQRIELCWVKIKTALRSLKARTVEALLEAIKTALASITDSDARAWFEYCGYCVHT